MTIAVIVQFNCNCRGHGSLSDSGRLSPPDWFFQWLSLASCERPKGDFAVYEMMSEPPLHPMPIEHPRRIGVARSDDALRVIAIEPIEEGGFILEVHGVFVDHPSKYSVQVAEHLHVDLPMATGLTADPDRHPWRYLNHSCDPNAALVGLRLMAFRPISRWEEITFDYNTTEYEISTPFSCQCGKCGGSLIRGFKFLPPHAQRELEPRLANHLRRKLGGNGAR